MFCEMNVEFDPRSCHLAFDDHDSYIGGQYGGPAVIELFNEVLSERGMGSIPDWPLLSSTGRRRVLDLALSTIEFGDNWSVAVPRQLVTRVAELGLVGNGSTTLRAETIQSVEKGVK